jgi:hypothetical protein
MPFGGEEPIYSGTPMRSAEDVVNGGGEPQDNIPNQKNAAESKVNGSDNAVEIARAQLMAQLATDPEISKILQARQTGKKVSIIDPDAVEPTQRAGEPETVDWDNLTNKDLVQKIPSVITPTLQKIIDDATKPLLEKIATLESATQQTQAEKVNNSIQAAKQKFSDFDNYRQQMLELNRKSPGLNVEELYYLAKAKAGDFNIPQPTSTERPTNTTARPSLREQRKTPLPNGVRGMSQLLDEALANRDFSMSDV